jgi:hypothetical protein
MSDRYRLAPLLVSNARTTAAAARALVDAEQRLAEAETVLRTVEARVRRERERADKNRARVRPGSASAQTLGWEGRHAVVSRIHLDAAERALEDADRTRSERAAGAVRARERLAGSLSRDQTLQRHHRAFMDRRRAEGESREHEHTDDAVNAYASGPDRR